MQIFIDGTPIAALSPQHRRRLRLCKPQPKAAGKVLSADEATRHIHAALRSRTRTAAVAVGVFAIIFFLLLLLAKALTILFGVALAGGTLAFFALMRYACHFGQRKWQRTLEERLRGLPSAGTTLRADDAGLVVGAAALPWSDLAIITLSLNWFSLNQQTYYLIDRLVLQARERTFSLDTSMITNGQCVVDQIYRRLAPQLGP